MARLIAVGDIHGQYDKLTDLITVVSPAEDDQLVFLGDYIDRGEKTPAVLDWLIEFQRQFPKTIFLRGNHEQMLLDAISAVEKKNSGRSNLLDDFLALRGNGLPEAVFYFVSCGGWETLAAYTGSLCRKDPCESLMAIPREHLDFLRRTRLFFEHSDYFFVHAGVNPNDPTGQRGGNQTFLWERRPVWKGARGWNKVVVHGHTPVAEPYFDCMEINIDTGAGFGSRLTACDVMTKTIWQSG